MKIIILFLVLSLGLVGCASSYMNSPQSMKGEEYQKKETLKSSLFSSTLPISEQDIKTILNSKMVLPQKVRVGIIKIEHKIDYSFWSGYGQNKMNQSSFQLSDDVLGKFIGEIKKNSRVKDVVIVPSMLVAGNFSIYSLREMAVRMQLDELLIMRSESRSDYEFRPFVKDKVNASTTVEAVMLDTRTGLIPFSSIVSGKEVVLEISRDRTQYELAWRAALESETHGLIEVAKNFVSFIGNL